MALNEDENGKQHQIQNDINKYALKFLSTYQNFRV